MRARWWLMLSVTALAGMTAVMVACNHNVSATADCTNLEKYESRSFGVLNGMQYSLGTIIMLNPAQHYGYRVTSAEPLARDLEAPNPPIDTLTMISNADFKLSFSADVPATVNAQATAAVNNNTAFFLQKYVRQNVRSAASLVNSRPAALAELMSAMQRYPSNYFIVVSGVALVDRLSFQLRGSTQAGAGVQVSKYGNYSVSVAYSCQASLDAYTRQGAVFFRFEPLVPAAGGQVAIGNADIDLKDYRLVNAFTAQ